MKDLNGKKLTKTEKRDYRERGWRMYDNNCPYSMSHTKYFCGYPKCPED